MPFQFTPYDNSRSAQTIGELMRQQGAIRAKALEDAAAARARAAEIGGHAWGGAVANAGNAVAGSIGAYMRAKELQPRLELEQQRVDAGKQRQAGQGQLDTLMAGDQLPPNDAGPRQESYTDANGLFDIPRLNQALAKMGSGHLAPELLKGAEAINESITKHQALEQQAAQTKSVLIGDLADGALKLAKLGMPVPDAMDFVVQPALATKRIQPQEYAQLRQQIVALPPEQQQAALGTFMDAAAKAGGGKMLGKDAQEVDRYGRTMASNMVPEKPTEASLAADLSSPDAAVRARAETAMKALKPAPAIKPGTVEDWVTRARRLAVAQNDGKPLSDVELQAVDTKALQGFKETNADPELRAAALAQKNMALILAKMQADQMPTKEQAASVADDLVNHRLAPEQLASLFSTRGKEGLAFKLNVGAEAKKLDPQFNWEEASATYALAKSTGFQNTVRIMDSVQESMPRLLANAKNLGNGNWRSWSQLANAAKTQFNSTDLKRLKTDALLVGDEVAKILAGGGTGSATSDAKLKQGTDLFNTSDSVPAIAAALDEIQTLIGYRRKTLTRGTYMEGTGAVKPAETSSAPVVGDRRTFNGKIGVWDGKGWKPVQP